MIVLCGVFRMTVTIILVARGGGGGGSLRNCRRRRRVGWNGNTKHGNQRRHSDFCNDVFRRAYYNIKKDCRWNHDYLLWHSYLSSTTVLYILRYYLLCPPH